MCYQLRVGQAILSFQIQLNINLYYSRFNFKLRANNETPACSRNILQAVEGGVSTTYLIKTCKGVQCINITPYVFFFNLCRKQKTKYQWLRKNIRMSL